MIIPVFGCDIGGEHLQRPEAKCQPQSSNPRQGGLIDSIELVLQQACLSLEYHLSVKLSTSIFHMLETIRSLQWGFHTC